MAIKAAKSLLSSVLQSDKRSTVLHSLQWMMAILVAGLVSTSATSGPTWLLVAFAGSIGVVLVCYLAAFWFFAKTSPEMLRSEQFSIRKMEIERGYIGDNVSGFLEPTIEDARGSRPPLLTKREVKNE